MAALGSWSASAAARRLVAPANAVAKPIPVGAGTAPVLATVAGLAVAAPTALACAFPFVSSM